MWVWGGRGGRTEPPPTCPVRVFAPVGAFLHAPNVKRDKLLIPDATGQEAARVIIDEKELLARIPFSRRTLHTLRKKGKLPFINTGGRKNLYHWESVQAAFLRMQRGAGE